MRRSLFGYRRADVDAVLVARDGALAASAAQLNATLAELEACQARIVELELVADRLSDYAVARERGAAAAREELEQMAAERDRLLDELRELAEGLEPDEALRKLEEGGVGREFRVEHLSAPARIAEDVFVGSVELDVGPLEDFAGLVGVEDALAGLDATASVAVLGFAAGRASLALKLREPVALLDALAAKAPFGFTVRESDADRIVLDVVAAPSTA